MLICTYIFDPHVVIIKHSGHHNHPRPPVKKPSPAALRLFETVVKRNPDFGPQKLQIGGTTQTPVTDQDDSFCTVGHVKHYQKKALSHTMKPLWIQGTIGSLVQLMKDIPDEFIVDVNPTSATDAIILSNLHT